MIELDLPALYFFLPRIGIAIICGAIIGLERELTNKSAGLKTLVLICLGSALFASISVFMGTGPGNEHVDKSRIIAQIVSGIGFLGAGVILQGKAGVLGLTSAAIVWFTGAIGALIGIGFYDLAIIFSVISVSCLVIFRWIEFRINSKYELSTPHYYTLKISGDPETEMFASIQDIIKNNQGTITYSSINKDKTSKDIFIRYVSRPKLATMILQDIYKIPGIISIFQEESAKEAS